MSKLVLVALALAAANCVLLRDNGAISEAAPASDGLYNNDPQHGNIAHINDASGDERPVDGSVATTAVAPAANVTLTWKETVIGHYLPGEGRPNRFNRCDFVPDDMSEQDIVDLINSDEPECPICRLNTNETMVKLDCGHEFHRACLFRWYTGDEPNHNRCPVCRKYMSINRQPISSRMLRP